MGSWVCVSEREGDGGEKVPDERAVYLLGSGGDDETAEGDDELCGLVR